MTRTLIRKRPDEWTEQEIDAAVLMRADARAVAAESALLTVDRPNLTVVEMHASLGRLMRVDRMWWDSVTQLVRAPGALGVQLRDQPGPAWRAALERAWRAGNAWRGCGTSEVEARVWAYHDARAEGLAWWPPQSDDDGPAPLSPLPT